MKAFCPVGIGGTKGIDTTHLKIFVGGLSPDHSSQDLYDIFRPFGQIRESVVIPDRFRVRSRCYGFVTFVEHESVSDVFQQLPIMTKRGSKLTVVLASANTKPRRAHFNVKHGTSGHKPLPMVKEEEDDDELTNHRQLDPVNSIMVRTNVNFNKYHQKSAEAEDRKIGIYTDPSLFRTANIQPIAPATLHIAPKTKKEQHNELWPNEDIKKDFHHLKKVVVSDQDRVRSGSDPRKSWKLVSVSQESEQYSEYGLEDQSVFHEPQEFYAQNSRKWTPLSEKRTPGDSLANSVVSVSCSYRSSVCSPKRRVAASIDHKVGNKKNSKLGQKWVRSPKKCTPSEGQPASDCDTKGLVVGYDEEVKEGEPHGADDGGDHRLVRLVDADHGNDCDHDEEEEEDDRMTFASLFDGSYQRLLLEQQDAVNMNLNMNNMMMVNHQTANLAPGQTMNGYMAQTVPGVQYEEMSQTQPMNEIETLRHIFKNRMDQKIGATQPVFNQNQNGLWSPYQPAFPTQYAVSSGAIPSVPIYASDQSQVGSQSNGSLQNAAMYTFDQRNVVFNTNYFYSSSPMITSQSTQ